MNMVKETLIGTGIIVPGLIAQHAHSADALADVPYVGSVIQLGAFGVMAATFIYLLFKYLPGRDKAQLEERTATRKDFQESLSEIASGIHDNSQSCERRHEKLRDTLDRKL